MIAKTVLNAILLVLNRDVQFQGHCKGNVGKDGSESDGALTPFNAHHSD